MGFESVRGYVQLASGLSELTRARATEAAQGLLSLPGVGIASGKVAVQVGALAEELLAAATTNRENLTALVRSEVDVAVTRLGLVSVEKLEESQAEAARLRVQVAELRSATAAKKTAAKKTAAKKTAAKKTAAKKTAATKSTATKSTAKKSTAKKTTAKDTSATNAAAKPTAVTKAAKTAKTATKATTTRRSAVTTRRKPAGT